MPEQADNTYNEWLDRRKAARTETSRTYTISGVHIQPTKQPTIQSTDHLFIVHVKCVSKDSSTLSQKNERRYLQAPLQQNIDMLEMMLLLLLLPYLRRSLLGNKTSGNCWCNNCNTQSNAISATHFVSDRHCGSTVRVLRTQQKKKRQEYHTKG